MKRPIFSLMTAMFALPAQAETHDVYGLWLTEARDGLVEVSDCGDGTPCGALVWADPDKTVSDYDVRNKEVPLQNRHLIGAPTIWGFERSEKGWKGGQIYNPEDGKTFRASVKRQDADRLKVKGCLGPLCISNTWMRIPAVLEVQP